jgi:hypothetical protein
VTFYFAWVGGTVEPEFTLSTVGDVWGGSVTTYGSTWSGSLKTNGDILVSELSTGGYNKISNLRSVAGLQVGTDYYIMGAGISPSIGNRTVAEYLRSSESNSQDSLTKFGYDGQYGGTLEPPALNPMENTSVIITTQIDTETYVPFGQNIVVLGDDSGLGRNDLASLVAGTTYLISGGGIPADTYTTFDGTVNLTLTNPCTTTAKDAALTLSNAEGRTTITNLGDTTGLTIGQTYQIFGRGLSSGCLATFDGTNLQLSSPATVTTLQTPLQIHLGATWPDGGDFVSDYAREDETVLDIKIDHTEGNFPLLSIGLKNPKIGLLGPTRSVWCWVSWLDDSNPDAEVVPLFHGRLVALPLNVQGEKITLQFIAQPADYQNQQTILMQSLMVAPYYDPIWLSSGVATVENILEAYTKLWHIDRVSLDVTVSDITIGEDGTLVVNTSDHLYDKMEVKYGNPPLSSVYITGTVNWSQEGNGEIDITDNIVSAFDEQDGAYSNNTIASYTADGLLAGWPKPGTNIGGGWSFSDESWIIANTAFEPKSVTTSLVGGALAAGAQFVIPESFGLFGVKYPFGYLTISVTLTYTASRPWTEVVTFFLEADTQNVVTDSRSSTESYSLSSSILTELIDPDGTAPMSDTRTNTYFKTARGQQSFQWLLQYGKAKLMARARAVDIEMTTPFVLAMGLSCRWNVTVNDDRLPGGTATGKVKAYSLVASASEGMIGTVTIGCTIGNGGSQTPLAGTPTYVQEGYVASGYQAMTGAMIDSGDGLGTLVYESFDDFSVEDDGVNFYDMDPADYIKQLYVVGGPKDQEVAVALAMSAISSFWADPWGNTTETVAQLVGAGSQTNSTGATTAKPQTPTPQNALAQTYTMVVLEMEPVTGGAFLSQFAVNVSKLSIPKTIDLTAAADEC